MKLVDREPGVIVLRINWQRIATVVLILVAIFVAMVVIGALIGSTGHTRV